MKSMACLSQNQRKQHDHDKSGAKALSEREVSHPHPRLCFTPAGLTRRRGTTLQISLDLSPASFPVGIRFESVLASLEKVHNLVSSNQRLSKVFTLHLSMNLKRHTTRSCTRLDALIDSANLGQVDWHFQRRLLENLGELNARDASISVCRRCGLVVCHRLRVTTE
jgi:hypothetical protein